MWQRLEPRLRDIARRAGMADIPPAVLVAACGLCALACLWALWRWWPRDIDQPAPEAPFQIGEVAPVPSGPSGGASDSASPAVCVHVVGAVRHPGVYELTAGSRVADAVEAAGGMLPGAVAAAVNLARPVTDGEQIVVPDEDDPSASVPAIAGGTGMGAVGAPPQPNCGPVDINTADAALLDTLPGIGPSTAQKIIVERETNGPFSSVDDLARVSGIGPKKLEQLAGVACVR